MPKIKTIPLLEVVFKNNGGTQDIWKAISELLHNKEEEISVFCPYIKNKINSYDKDISLLALTLLEYCVDNGRMPLWLAVCSKNFYSSIVHNLKTREETEIQDMILYLIQKWGIKFRNNNELSNFESVYTLMKNNNITFPTEINNNYSKYVRPLQNKTNNYNNSINNNKSNNQTMKVETDPEDYLKDIKVNLNTSSYDRIYKRLVNKLYDWTHAIHEANVLINQNNDGQNNPQIESLCKDLAKGNKQLIETIQSGKLKDKTLMEISLNVTDDINMTLGRWNNYKNGKFPGPFISSFFQNDEWRNKKINKMNNMNNMNNSNNNKSNYNNLTNFYNINNSTINNNFNNNNQNNFNNNNQNNFNNINYSNNFNNNVNRFSNNINNNISNNNINNNNNYFNNTEIKNYPKLYERLSNPNNNYPKNQNNMNNNFQNNNFQNLNNNNNNSNINLNNNNNNKQDTFNLLIDFESAPMSSSSNNNNNMNLNLNDKNNMDKFVDFIRMTEKQNEINNKKNNNNNFETKNNNHNNPYNYENKDIDNPFNERKFSNDNNGLKINNTVMYPSFEELEESNSNNNNFNPGKNLKEEKEDEDILEKFDF